MPDAAEAKAVGSLIDSLVGRGCNEVRRRTSAPLKNRRVPHSPDLSCLSQIDILSGSAEARELLNQLVGCKRPLLPRHTAALLVAIAPTNGITAASERAASVYNSASPFTSHVVRNALELVARSATDAPRMALVLALLAPLLVGRDAAEAQEDNGLIAWVNS